MTSKFLISNTNPQNPSNIRNVTVIFLLFQVNCEFLNFHDHFYLAQFAFSRETILNMFTRDGHNQFIFMKCFQYQVLSPVPNLYAYKSLHAIWVLTFQPYILKGLSAIVNSKLHFFQTPRFFFLPIQRELHCNN